MKTIDAHFQKSCFDENHDSSNSVLIMESCYKHIIWIWKTMYHKFTKKCLHSWGLNSAAVLSHNDIIFFVFPIYKISILCNRLINTKYVFVLNARHGLLLRSYTQDILYNILVHIYCFITMYSTIYSSNYVFFYYIYQLY